MITLPSTFRYQAAKAMFEGGVLRIELEKRPDSKPRKISLVKVDGESLPPAN